MTTNLVHKSSKFIKFSHNYTAYFKDYWTNTRACLYSFSSTFHAESKYCNEKLNIGNFWRKKKCKFWPVVSTRYPREERLIFTPKTICSCTWDIQKYDLRTCTCVCILTHPDSYWPATWVSYNVVPMWLLQVGVLLRVWGYSAATGCVVALVTVASEYPHSTLKRYSNLQ